MSFPFYLLSFFLLFSSSKNSNFILVTLVSAPKRNFDQFTVDSNEIHGIQSFEPLLGLFLYKIGPIQTLKLCKNRLLDCPENGLIYKYIQSGHLFGNVEPTLGFDHVKKCKWISEMNENPMGFTTKNECFKTMNDLRKWVELQDFALDEIIEFKGFGFDDALKCRWMRKQPEWNQEEWEKQSRNCLVNIIQQRALLGTRPFTNEELAQLNESRIISEYFDFGFSPSFGLKFFNPDDNPVENYKIKLWLDQGGNVSTEWDFWGSYLTTVLQEAVNRGDLYIVKLLIAAGSNVDETER